MLKEKDRSILMLTLGCFFAFLAFGFIDNLKGPTITPFLKDLNFSYSQGGTIIFIGYIGFVIATLTTGIVSDMVGRKAGIFIGLTSLFIGTIAYGLLSYFWFLAIAMLFLGFGLGSIDLGTHSIIVDIHRQSKGRYLNLLTFFYGAGAMIGSFYAGQLIRMNFTWRQVYLYSLILIVVVLTYFMIVKYPKDNNVSESKKRNLIDSGKSAFTKETCLYYLLIASYIGIEVGIASWMVEFLQKVKFQSVGISSLFLTLYFGAIMIGRFFGSFLVDFIGYLKSILIVSLAAACCILIGIFGPSTLVFFLPLSGLFLSIIMPTSVAAVSGLHPDNTGIILGISFTFVGIGRMVGPWIIGIFSDLLGIKLGFSMTIVFCSLLIATVIVLKKKENKI
ncbi:MAG: sugar MFS transporter [Clostridia bacterium]